jgi:hypothetical protein
MTEYYSKMIEHRVRLRESIPSARADHLRVCAPSRPSPRASAILWFAQSFFIKRQLFYESELNHFDTVNSTIFAIVNSVIL